MKITYEFDSNEDSGDLKLIQNVDKFYFALDEIYNKARQQIKYNPDPTLQSTLDVLEDIKGIAGMIHSIEDL